MSEVSEQAGVTNLAILQGSLLNFLEAAKGSVAVNT